MDRWCCSERWRRADEADPDALTHSDNIQLAPQQRLGQDPLRYIHRLDRIGETGTGLRAILDSVDELAILGLEATIDV